MLKNRTATRFVETLFLESAVPTPDLEKFTVQCRKEPAFRPGKFT